MALSAEPRVFSHLPLSSGGDGVSAGKFESSSRMFDGFAAKKGRGNRRRHAAQPGEPQLSQGNTWCDNCVRAVIPLYVRFSAIVREKCLEIDLDAAKVDEHEPYSKHL